MIHARLSLCRGTWLCVFAQGVHCLAHFFQTEDQDRWARVLREKKVNRGCICKGWIAQKGGRPGEDALLRLSSGPPGSRGGNARELDC